MIKLFKVKEKQREIAANANGKPPVKKQTAGELRLQKGSYFIFIFIFGEELLNLKPTLKP